MREVRVWVGPDPGPMIARAIEEAGGVVVADPSEANAFAWYGLPPEKVKELLHPGVEWVQLHSAGIDSWFERGVFDEERIWTRVEEVYSADVAEHVVAFLLAAVRGLPQAARRTTWEKVGGDRLVGKVVGIVGAGSVGRETIARLAPFGTAALALTRSGREIDGAERSLAADGLDDLLRESDFVVLTAPLTRETDGLMDARRLSLMQPSAWLVNVARGRLVVTDDLVAALERGQIAGACLDVTEPEPLPDDHPLWRFPNVLITPHVANPPGTYEEPLARLVGENVRRFREGRDLVGVVDVGRGY